MSRFLLSVLVFSALSLSALSAAAQSNDIAVQGNDGAWPPGADGRSHRLDGWAWAGEPFGEPVFLVRCVQVSRGANPCPGDNLMLVADLNGFPGATLRPIGGPYLYRWQLEEDRARLVQVVGLPEHSLRLTVWSSAGHRIGQFWMGARPDCLDPPSSDRGLEGEVNAGFAPGMSRPPSLPLGYDLDDYIRDMEQLRPTCEARRANMRRLSEAREGFGSPPPGAAGPPPGQPPSEIRHRVVQTIETVYEECWKAAGAAYAAPATCRDATIWTFVLNDGSAHADRRQYDEIRRQFAASGMTFAYATIKSEKRY